MSRTPKSRSIAATPEGLKKVRCRMAELKKPDSEIIDKRCKKSWTQDYLVKMSFVEISTVKRFLNGDPVDESSLQSIISALGLNRNDVVDERDLHSSAQTINWREVCSTMLEPHRRISSNFLMQDESARKDKEQIYVPLALVQRTKTDKRDKGNFSPDLGTRLYEPQYETQQRFEHEAFLSQILEGGEGKTKGQQIAVIGEPGAGKTTLLQTIAFWVLEKNLGLPVWITLADLGRNGILTDIQTYICNSWLEQAIPATQLTQEVREDFTNQIQQGRVWLLLDGVDEMSEASHQPLEEISRQLNGWLRSSRVVLTCRLNVWQADVNALETFETYRLLDFDYPQQVHQFIDNWFGNLSEKGERLKTELDSAERVRLRDLVQTPLRLALLCGIWQTEEGNLPETKAGLYHQCVQQFYRWKQNRFRTSKKEQHDLNEALGRLALRDINEGSSRFRLLESFISEELGYPDDETSLFYKAWQLGWLNHVGIAAESSSKEKVYAFYHATFEEYFAALAVDDWHYFLKHVPENPEQGIYRIFEPQWKEVILLWFGREDLTNKQKEDFIKALVEFEDGWEDFYKYRAYFIAGAAIAEFQDGSSINGIQEAFLERELAYYKELLMSDNLPQELHQERANVQGVSGFAELMNRSTANEIVTNIAILAFGYYYSDIKKEWRKFLMPFGVQEAKIALQETDRNRAITLLSWLIQTKQPRDMPSGFYGIDEEIPGEAARVLGKIGRDNQIAVKALEYLIKVANEETLRWIVADNLAKIDPSNKMACEALKELIQNAKHEHTRKIAAWSLGKIDPGNPNAIKVLVKMIQSPQEEANRLSAASHLREIDPDNQDVINVLLPLLQLSQPLEIRHKAATCLGQFDFGKKIAIKTLEEIIHNESIALRVAIDLAELVPNNPIAISVLEQKAFSIDQEMTCAFAAKNLVKIQPSNQIAIEALKSLIQTTKDGQICQIAAGSLGDIDPGNKIAVRALVNLIQAFSYDPVQLMIAETLNRILLPNQCSEVVKSLKFYLLKQRNTSGDSRRFCDCYKVIWHCAQTMTYPAFYQAWHSD
ncbi:MAG: HEAT repeat domain-containing protein [Nostoc sp.]